MLRVLTQKQAEILKHLSDKYLQTEDDQKISIEVVVLTEMAVVFWIYPIKSTKGTKITMPWFEFTIGVLAPVMFKSQPFKFNGIISKCIMRPETEREDLLEAFQRYDTWVEDTRIRKEKDQKNKNKSKAKTEEIPSI